MADNAGVPYERLHQRARELLAAGALPRENPGQMYGGYGGSGKHCGLCEMPITAKEVEYELEFATTGLQRSGERTFWFHLACHAIWDYERKRLP